MNHGAKFNLNIEFDVVFDTCAKLCLVSWGAIEPFEELFRLLKHCLHISKLNKNPCQRNGKANPSCGTDILTNVIKNEADDNLCL